VEAVHHTPWFPNKLVSHNPAPFSCVDSTLFVLMPIHT
jgi:hypothetical protein